LTTISRWMNDPRASEREAGMLLVGASVAVDAVTADVVTALQDAGITPILLKGPSVTRWLYGPESSRVSVDVDLLVAPATRYAAQDVLTQLGFSPSPANVEEERRHARAWRRRGSPIAVDLHVTLPGVGVSAEEAWRVLSRDTERLSVGGVDVDALSARGRALHLAIHAAQHGVGFDTPVADLRRAVARLPLEVWRDAAALASSLHAEPMFTTGLGLVDSGKAVLVALGVAERKTVEVALRARTPPDLALGLHRLTTIPGLLPKAAFVARKAFPPPAWMRAWLPLAGRGNVGLAVAYAWRPIWIVLRMPAALRAWRRARNESRQSSR
jgi:hypothetical protein